MIESCEKTLAAGLDQLGLTPDIDKLINYLLLLEKWNKAYNLTSVRAMSEMITRHVLDSLAISSWINGPNLLDVGAGAGLPGIPLAIANPNLNVVLLDSNGKKVRFMQEVKRVLGLNNIEIIESRVENYHPHTAFDTVTSRAFSELAQMISWTKHLLATNGIWLAMKGRYPAKELEVLSQPYQVIPYTVPGLDSERCCVIIKNETKE